MSTPAGAHSDCPVASVDNTQVPEAHVETAPQGGVGAAATESLQWLEEALAGHTRREDGLALEISALREASAVGAAALIELRAAVQAQLEGLSRQSGKLDQDLAATKLELAEVVIDKESREAEMKDDIEAELLRTRGHFNELHMTVREALEQRVAEVRQVVETEGRELRQLLEGHAICAEATRKQDQFERDAVTQRLEGLEAGKEETMSYFDKIDKVMQHETSGVMQKLDHLSRAQAGSEENCRRVSEELRRMIEDCSGQARRFQELHKQLEPRVFHLEEAQRHSEARVERIQDQVQSLLASRFSSPANDPREATVDELVASNLSRHSACAAGGPIAPAAGSNGEGGDDTWRFPHSACEPTTPALAIGSGAFEGACRTNGSSAGRTRDGPVRDCPSRTAQAHVALQPPPPPGYRAAAAPSFGSSRSPPRTAPSPAMAPPAPAMR